MNAEREAQWLRMLLGRIATDLDRLATHEPDEPRAKLLRGRAALIRRRLHEGMPPGWAPSMPTGPSPVMAALGRYASTKPH